MLGSVGGLVEVISKVVDNVVASDAEVVLKTVRGYVTRSFMRFIYLFNFLPHCTETDVDGTSCLE